MPLHVCFVLELPAGAPLLPDEPGKAANDGTTQDPRDRWSDERSRNHGDNATRKRSDPCPVEGVVGLDARWEAASVGLHEYRCYMRESRPELAKVLA